ncbi:MAG: exonuclease SbcCD subunit D [Lachnospiraceae bacterium]|nr:exonuclease SbcCD subunit D [Lachnospiraceae bacterium]
MKLLHLGDLHIGKSVNDYSMIEDQKYILDQILEIAQEQSVDGVLIAGDVYDKSVPSEEAVRIFDYFLCQLADRQILAFIISGNHDSDERLHFGSALFETNGIYITSKYEGTLAKQTLTDEYGNVNIYLLPFVKASQVRHFWQEEKIESYDQAVRVVVDHTDMDAEERNILVAHQFVAGRGTEPKLGGSENAAVQNVGAVEMVGTDCFTAFDYVALGHIHSPQKIGRDTIRYSGSPLKYSLSEIDNQKSVPIVTLGKKGDVEVELVPLQPLRDMRHLKGRMEQILNRDNIQTPEDYIYVTLTDEYSIPDAMAVIRQYYPNTMKIDYDNSHTRTAGQIDVSQVTREKSFSEIISDFYQMMYGCGISEEERELMMEVAGEAGVIDETN